MKLQPMRLGNRFDRCCRLRRSCFRPFPVNCRRFQPGEAYEDLFPYEDTGQAFYLVFAASFSGHGFKFAPPIGEALMQMSLNETSSLRLDFLSMKRLA